MNLTKLAKALRDIADALEEDPIGFLDPSLPEPEDAAPEPTVGDVTTPAPTPAPAPTPEELSTALTAAAKAHGRTKVMGIMNGRKLADLSDTERSEVANQLEAL